MYFTYLDLYNILLHWGKPVWACGLLDVYSYGTAVSGEVFETTTVGLHIPNSGTKDN